MLSLLRLDKVKLLEPSLGASGRGGGYLQLAIWKLSLT